MEAILIFLGGILAGILLLIGYGAYRAVNSPGWDDSNVTNWLRVFSHMILHPEDFARMYYPDDNEPYRLGMRPFWYIGNDELSEVVHTRPRQ